MSRAPAITPLVALCALGVAGSTATVPARADSGRTKVRQPTLLWKSYPLKTRKRIARAQQAGIRSRRQASSPTPAEGKQFPSLLVMTLLLAALVAAGMIVLTRLGLVPVGVSASRRGRAPPKPEPSPVAVGWRRKPKPRPAREPALDVQLQRLIERVEEAPLPEREQLAKEIAMLHGLIGTTRPAPEPRTREPRPAPPRRPQLQETGVERCQIKLWRGFVKCQLYAVPIGSDEPLAFSPYFRLRDGTELTAQAVDALHALVEALEQEGWTVVSDGPSWYQYRLERPEYDEPL